MNTVFVHIPKTAGTALRSAVTARVGAQSIHFDYGSHDEKTWYSVHLARAISRLALMTNNDMRITKLLALLWSRKQRPLTRPYVYGHFVTAKYLRRQHGRWSKIPGYRYVTFVRHPFQRAISQYYYYKQSSAPHDLVLREFHAAQMSLVDFLLHPFFANTMSRFLYGLSVDEFDMVGVVEDMPSSLRLLGHLLPEFADLELQIENKTSYKYLQEIYEVPGSVYQSFRSLHAQDFSLYNHACEKLQKNIHLL